MSAHEIDKSVRDWWRELGFYYDIDTASKCWRVVGDYAGIQKFVRCLREYATDSRNNAIGEHEHYGPYYYLEIGTSDKCEINDHWIAGPLPSIRRWADQIDHLIAKAGAGDVIFVGKLLASDSLYDFAVELRVAGFDPAAEDLRLNLRT